MEVARAVFEAVGRVVVVDEYHLDAGDGLFGLHVYPLIISVSATRA